MRDIFLIRHSITEGNLKNRYIGTTDEVLCPQGRALLLEIKQQRDKDDIEHVYVSPLKRCLETADILYPNVQKTTVKGLRECDFGIFENKNYQELDGSLEYQKWIDSNGTLPFPGGEDPKVFRERSVEAFLQTVEKMKEKRAAFVVHGGTIMSIMEALIQPRKNFYEYHVKNGCGYHLREENGNFLLYEKIEHLVEKTKSL